MEGLHAGNDFRYGGFTGTIDAYNGDAVATFDADVGISDDGKFAVGFTEVDKFDDGLPAAWRWSK